MIKHIQNSKVLTGIAYMVLAMFCFAVMNTAVRQLSETMTSPLMVFMRNVASLVMISFWIAVIKKNSSIKTTRIMDHIWRGTVGFVGMELWFYSLTLMPLTLATALSFTAPIFGTIFAIVLLKEKAGMHRWCAIMTGFAGVIVILQPGSENISVASAVVLLASALMALTGIMVKRLSVTESPAVIVFYMTLIMTPLSFPIAIPDLRWPTGFEALIVCVIALFSSAAHVCMAIALKRAQMVVLSPFDFTRLLFTALMAYFFFGEVLDTISYIGALIIVASTFYIVYRESKHNQPHITTPSQT